MRKILIITTLLLGLGCTATPDTLLDPGISRELAQWRKQRYHNPRYTLHFDIPASRSEDVSGVVTISLSLDKSEDIIIDYRESDNILSVKLNNADTPYEIINEHIVLRNAPAGENSVMITFTASDQSLNRQEEYMYTLLVPDRARTLFPCFEQPDMKATYTLSLTLPEAWEAVSNTAQKSSKR